MAFAAFGNTPYGRLGFGVIANYWPVADVLVEDTNAGLSIIQIEGQGGGEVFIDAIGGLISVYLSVEDIPDKLTVAEVFASSSRDIGGTINMTKPSIIRIEGQGADVFVDAIGGRVSAYLSVEDMPYQSRMAEVFASTGNLVSAHLSVEDVPDELNVGEVFTSSSRDIGGTINMTKP